MILFALLSFIGRLLRWSRQQVLLPLRAPPLGVVRLELLVERQQRVSPLLDPRRVDLGRRALVDELPAEDLAANRPQLAVGRVERADQAVPVATQLLGEVALAQRGQGAERLDAGEAVPEVCRGRSSGWRSRGRAWWRRSA
jgi:hypothetical protein